jgi:hypothetical protein
MSDSFPIQNGLKQGDALSPLFFNIALEYSIRKAQKNQVGLKFNGTRQLPTYADNVNLLRDNIDTMNVNMETLSEASKEVHLEIYVEKITYMVLSHHQKKKNSVAFNPQVNYTNSETTTSQRILMLTLYIERCWVVSMAEPPWSLISVF